MIDDSRFDPSCYSVSRSRVPSSKTDEIIITVKVCGAREWWTCLRWQHNQITMNKLFCKEWKKVEGKRLLTATDVPQSSAKLKSWTFWKINFFFFFFWNTIKLINVTLLFSTHCVYWTEDSSEWESSTDGAVNGNRQVPFLKVRIPLAGIAWHVPVSIQKRLALKPDLNDLRCVPDILGSYKTGNL